MVFSPVKQYYSINLLLQLWTEIRSLCALGVSNYIINIGKINKPILRPGQSPSTVQCTLAAVLLRTAEVILVEGVGVCGGAGIAANGALPLSLEHARLGDNQHAGVSVSEVHGISLLIKKWISPKTSFWIAKCCKTSKYDNKMVFWNRW